MTKEQAQQWIDSRQWDNGWNVNPDKSIDAVEFATQYAANKPLWDKLFHFLATTDLNTLPAGKHVIDEGKVWVNVLEYTPKDAAGTKIESHIDFIDLQYTVSGHELMGLATGTVTPVAPYDPVKDKTNYTTDGPIEYSPASPDLFFLYFPADMHQPSVAAPGEIVPSRKIVGKIAVAK